MLTMTAKEGGEPGNGIRLAIMTGPNSLKIGELELEAEDLMFASHLLHSACTKVAVNAPAGGGACTDKSTYTSALKKGDCVAVIQYSDEKFLVLERMVSL